MEFSIAFFGILGKFSVFGGAPTINAKNFSSLAFLLGHKRSLCPFLLYRKLLVSYRGGIRQQKCPSKLDRHSKQMIWS